MANTVKIYYTNSSEELPSINTNVVTLLSDLNTRLGFTGNQGLGESFAFDFSVYLETSLMEGDLAYAFKPFKNMVLEDSSIVDFSTKDLHLSLSSPVDIEVQPSYDGTVNLIISDNLNPPRLINSRFSATEGKRYYITDRLGNKDTNLYDYDKIDSQTKLYKTINKIPKLDFLKLSSDGKLAVGNYVFYFRLVDADDNETDIITESGIVSCHIGGVNDPLSIRGGMGNENSGKSILFKFTDLDSNYSFLNIYYSRSTSDYNEQEITSYYKITTKFSIKSEVFEFRITGYEPIETITRDRINLQYNIIDRNKSAAQVQSRLFLANIHKATLPFQELKDLSCRILAYPHQIDKLNLGFLNTDYTSLTPGACAYYNSENIYNYTGYWEDEIYRVAIVYIMNDYSLSDPYDIRGGDFSKFSKLAGAAYTSLNDFPLHDAKGDRQYLKGDENGFLEPIDKRDFLENIKGVIRIRGNESQIINREIKPIGIKIEIPKEIQDELLTYSRGFFIVRQKRIPTIIGQGFSIGHDTISGLPLIPEYDKVSETTTHIIQGSTIHDKLGFNSIVTSYDSIDKALTLAFDKYRLPNKGEVFFTFVSDQSLHKIDPSFPIDRVKKGGALLVPDSILNSEELSQILSGSEFTVTTTRFAPIVNGFTRNISVSAFPKGKTMNELDKLATHFTIENYQDNLNQRVDLATLVYVSEDTTSVSFNDNYYSSRAGIPEEAWRFSAFLKEEFGLVGADPANYNGVNYKKAQNVLVRGLFMPFVGMVKKENNPDISSAVFYNIRTLGYSELAMRELFITRINDNAPFMSASDRFSWENFDKLGTRSLNVFRGDCFINQATIRVLRNFQDPESPTNDVVVNYDTLTAFPGYTAPVLGDVLELSGATKEDETGGKGVYTIIRSDVNANRLGYWVTLKFCSNTNFAFRCTDPTYTSEFAVFGKPRSFYPLNDRSLAGNNKLAESTAMNVGYNSTTSDKEYFVLPDLQAIKSDFTNRIMFSELHVNDATKNGYRIYEGLSYRDYTIEFGSITKIVAWGGNLIVVFENGVGMVPVNERTLAGTAEGGDVYTKGIGVLSEKPMMLSQSIGSSWKDSIKVSQHYIYGVDTTAKKIWRTEGTKFEVFSEFKVQKFLNDNLTLTVYDKTPIVGLKNVVTHYNSNKYDVMFTFYDQSFNEEEKVWNLCYNEQLNNWTTRYSWLPAFSENLDNTMFTFSRGTCKVTSMISKSISSADVIGSIYIDSSAITDESIEKTLSVSDYLSLFYENQAEDSFTDATVKTYSLSDVYPITVNYNKVIEFIDSPEAGKHPMAIGDDYNKICVIQPETDHVLLVYSIFNDYLRLSSNSKLYFYISDNTNESIAGDTLVSTKVDGDYINNSVVTTKTHPILKIKFHVDAVLNAEIANKLVKDGWSFNIMAVPFNTVILDTTEYSLTLHGKDRYNATDYQYTINDQDNTIYDNNIFKVDTRANLSVNSKAFKEKTAEAKYIKLLQVLSRIYFGILIDLKVIFNTAESTTLQGYDQFRDVVYIRPSLDTLNKLLVIFYSKDIPPLVPIRGIVPAVEFTSEQILEIRSVLRTTIERYTANSTTDLWKHGSSNVFGETDAILPAKWYGETHPFEFEFIVNGDELGIHKLFDNLKVISNKAEPESFQFEIIGDAYEFTEDIVLTNPNTNKYLKPKYALVEPAREATNNKTKERSIIVLQESKNIKTAGLRKGNIQYKEDMWEVQISTLKVKNLSTQRITESKIRDKYCRIRVKYAGSQLAIITALQTIYTLSYS